MDRSDGYIAHFGEGRQKASIILAFELVVPKLNFGLDNADAILIEQTMSDQPAFIRRVRIYDAPA
jgi:hypothetical protein